MNSWLQLQQHNAHADYNLLCLPFAGGFAEYFLPWRQHVPTNLQLCPVQLPGRSYRWQEPVFTDIQALLTTMLPVLRPTLQMRPYVLFGHSMGGYIVYEFCQLLMREGLPLPSLLVVSSVPAPKYWQARKLLSQLTEQEFTDFFFDLGGFHPELMKHEKFIKMQMALLRGDITLCESCDYVAAANFPFPILAMGGVEDEYVMMQSMAAWQEETLAEFHLEEFTGRHFYLNEHLPTIFDLIQLRLSAS